MLAMAVISVVFQCSITLALTERHKVSSIGNNGQPIGKAILDYSAASEYVEAHYGKRSYFGEPAIREEDIFDARNGVFCYRDKAHQPSKLDSSGFELFSYRTQTVDFTNMTQISSVYLQELRTLIPQALGQVEDKEVDSIVFWHPMLRGEDTEIQPRSSHRPSTAGVASMVHMDTDVGAYGLDGVLNLVEKNRIIEQDCDISVDWMRVRESLLKGKNRLILLNIWRPILPVKSAPLGIWATKHTNEQNSMALNFPDAIPDLRSCRWYIFSNMQPDEVLIFKQFDRDSTKQADFWHCAINLQDSKNYWNLHSHPRKSFDVKAMIILNEKVEPTSDRVGRSSTSQPVLLSLEESGEFCNAQGRRRNKR